MFPNLLVIFAEERLFLLPNKMCNNFLRQGNKRNRNLISCTVNTVLKTLTTVYSIQWDYTKCATIRTP